MNQSWRFLLAMIVCLAGAKVSLAYDESVHHAVLQVLARSGGYSPAAAALIADASQSMDDLDHLTAFSLSKLASETKDIAVNAPGDAVRNGPSAPLDRLVNLDHMCTGQLFHSLTEHRALVEQMHIDRINRALRDAGNDPAKRNLAMVYLGEYLHYLSDSVVHPSHPLLGHALELDSPDRPENDPDKLRTAMRLMKEKLDEFAGGEVKPTHWESDHFGNQTLPIPSADTLLNDREKNLADTVVNQVFKPTRNEETYKAAVTVDPDFSHALDEKREQKLTLVMAQFVEQNKDQFEPLAGNTRVAGEESAPDSANTGFRPHVTIKLDAYGDPVDSNENIAVFGRIHDHSIDDRPSFDGARDLPELVGERRLEVETAGLLAFRDKVEAAMSTTAPRPAAPADPLPPQPQPPQQAWALPSTPGGVALNPRLTLPDDIGVVRDVTLDERGVVLATDRGTFPLDAVDAQSLATILRTVSGGEVPYITIGSEPSDREGYARVTYSPSLWGTREGAMLYRADVQFKAIFAHYPFGDGWQLNTSFDTLVNGFPGSGGDSLRMWITSSDIRLALKDGRLAVDRHGMRIFGETTLMNEVVPDSALDLYARKLTDNWDAIALKLPEFRAVQQLALETALAFWIRQHRVHVNEIIWTIPDKEDFTPAYAPLAAFAGPHFSGVCGGVSLAPEDRSSGAGRIFFGQIASAIDTLELSGRPNWRLRALLAGLIALPGLLLILLTGAIFWLVQKRLPQDRRLTYFGATRRWIGILILQAVAAMIAAPFLAGIWMSRFDKDFLAFLATLVVSPILFYWVMNRRKINGGVRRPGFLAVLLWLLMPLMTGVLGIAAATITVLTFGSIPGPNLDRVLSAELAPATCLLEATTSATVDSLGNIHAMPWPRSMLLGQAAQFERRAVAAEEGQPDTIHLKSSPGSIFRAGTLQRIHWPSDAPVDPQIVHYSIDGQPPYAAPADSPPAAP